MRVHLAREEPVAVAVRTRHVAHEHAMTIYRWQASSVQLQRPLDEPPQVPMLKIAPDRIVYTEQWLRKDGFGPRQIWYRDPDRKGASLQYSH